MIGGIAANALNIYSGAISFTAIGFKLPLAARRAIVALGFGAIGFFVAWSGLSNAGEKYNNFLLIIAYWIAPWLAVMFCDMYLRRRQDPAQIEHLLFNKKYTNWAGPVAMAVGAGVSIWLFANQTKYVGLVPDPQRQLRRPDLRGRLRAHRRDLPHLAAGRGPPGRAPRRPSPRSQQASRGRCPAPPRHRARWRLIGATPLRTTIQATPNAAASRANYRGARP